MEAGKRYNVKMDLSTFSADNTYEDLCQFMSDRFNSELDINTTVEVKTISSSKYTCILGFPGVDFTDNGTSIGIALLGDGTDSLPSARNTTIYIIICNKNNNSLTLRAAVMREGGCVYVGQNNGYCSSSNTQLYWGNTFTRGTFEFDTRFASSHKFYTMGYGYTSYESQTSYTLRCFPSVVVGKWEYCATGTEYDGVFIPTFSMYNSNYREEALILTEDTVCYFDGNISHGVMSRVRTDDTIVLSPVLYAGFKLKNILTADQGSNAAFSSYCAWNNACNTPNNEVWRDGLVCGGKHYLLLLNGNTNYSDAYAQILAIEKKS